MRFESLLWMALAMFLAGGGWGENVAPAEDVAGSGEYRAADGGTDNPPPPGGP